MLTHLHIKNFTLVDQLDVELHQGLTAITGETGAGKSIMIDALGLTLGDRSDGGKVKTGAERAEVTASFDISKIPYAKKWLHENDLDHEGECILRRLVTKEGKSRAYINGQTVTIQQLRGLGESLIDIHNQHEHQSLLLSQTHQRLLDDYAETSDLVERVKAIFDQWQDLKKKADSLRLRGEEQDARFQLLHYQVAELDRLNLHKDEVESLEDEQRLLASTEKTQVQCRSIIDICDSEGVGLKDRIHQAIRLINDLAVTPDTLKEVASLLQSAAINIEEAQADVGRYLDSAEQNPERLHEVSQRLNAIYDIARKHKVLPEALFDLHQTLSHELEELSGSDEQIEKLQGQSEEKRTLYDTLANELSQKRTKAAAKLATAVNKLLKQLAMESANLQIELKNLGDNGNRYGKESVEFLISTIPGHPAQALQKVASGGELSRISLAIQVATARTSVSPTLIFDEVDVGIGGTTGDVVGEMLRELGNSAQIFCVTHLAQVASKAHHHYRVEKQLSRTSATSSLSYLNGEEKIIEIARMMGGKIDSKQSLDHAKHMLIERV